MTDWDQVQLTDHLVRQAEENDETMTEISYRGSFGTEHFTPATWERLAVALQNNTHVTSLELDMSREYNGENPQLFSYIEKSQSLKRLFHSQGNGEQFFVGLLQAMGKRKNALDYVYLGAVTISTNLMEPFLQFLQIAPVKCLRFGEFSLEGVEGTPQEAMLAAAAPTARIESYEVTWGSVPPSFLAALRNSTFVKHVKIFLECFDVPEGEDFNILHYPRIDDLRPLLRSCRNAPYTVCLDVSGFLPNELDEQDHWSVLVDELRDHDVVKEIICKQLESDEVLSPQVIRGLFAGTQRKLTVVCICHKGSTEMINAIVDCVSALELRCATSKSKWNYMCRPICQYTQFDFVTSFLSASSSASSVVKSVSLPVFDAACKNKIIQSLWKNRGLTEGVELVDHECIGGPECIGDDDRAVLKRLTQRNKHLTAMMDPEHLYGEHLAFLPYIFKLSLEIDLDEVFYALQSASAAFLPSNRSNQGSRTF